MDKEGTQEFMQNIVRQIAYLDLETMKAMNAEANHSRQMWDGIGALLHPSEYRDSMYDGAMKHGAAQENIVDHLIAIRELIDTMNEQSVQYRKFHKLDELTGGE